MTSVEKCLRFFARIQIRPSLLNLWPQLFGRDLPLPKQMFEIRGSSNRGINYIIMEIMARMALSPSINYHADGRDGTVLYINCAGRFSRNKFHSYLDKILSRSIPNEEETIHSMATYALDNLIVIDPKIQHPKYSKYLKFEDLVLEKCDIAIVIIDSIDEYEPEPNQKITKSSPYLQKVSYLKLILSEINVLTLYVRRNTNVAPPDKAVFTDVEAVLAIEDYSEGGMKVHYYGENNNHEIMFLDDTMLHH